MLYITSLIFYQHLRFLQHIFVIVLLSIFFMRFHRISYAIIVHQLHLFHRLSWFSINFSACVYTSLAMILLIYCQFLSFSRHSTSSIMLRNFSSSFTSYHFLIFPQLCYRIIFRHFLTCHQFQHFVSHYFSFFMLLITLLSSAIHHVHCFCHFHQSIFHGFLHVPLFFIFHHLSRFLLYSNIPSLFTFSKGGLPNNTPPPIRHP